MRYAITIAALLASGCLTVDNEVCSTGLVCPTGSVCSLTGDACGAPELVEACRNREEGESCEFGFCRKGVCAPPECGNGIVEPPGEQCDDGGESGGACSDDCQSEDRCGDGIVSGNEQCDCGDSVDNKPDICPHTNSDLGGPCRTDCIKHCGDGMINDAEQCDRNHPYVYVDCFAYGAASGTVSCTNNCGLDFSECKFDGWHDLSFLPLIDGSEAVTGVWAWPEPDPDVVAGAFSAFAIAFVTENGRMVMSLRPDENIYEEWTVGGKRLNAVTGFVDASDFPVLFAVGDDGVAYRYHPLEFWKPSVTNVSDRLTAVWTAGSDNTTFAVGENGTALRYDGMTWQPTATGLGSGVTLRAIHGRLFADIVAVGDGGAAIHWDGSQWTAMPATGTTENLNGVWLADNGVVYAVGDNGIVVRKVGDAWQTIDIGSTADLTAVWGRSDTDLFIGTADGSIIHRGPDLMWTPMDTGDTDRVNAIHGRSDVVLAATQNLRTYRGRAYAGPIYEAGVAMTDLEVSPTGEFFAVGAGGTVLTWRDQGWVDMSPLSTTDLTSVWAAASDDVYAVGSAGTVLHYTGTWQDMSLPVSVDLLGVWADATGYVIVVGAGGVAYERTASANWTLITGIGASEDLVAVWGRDTQDVHIAGRGADMYTWNGVTWASNTWYSVATEVALRDVKGTGGAMWTIASSSLVDGMIGHNQVGVVAEDPTFDFGAISVFLQFPLFHSLAVPGQAHALAGGRNGGLLELSKAGWHRVDTRVSGTIVGIAATTHRVAFVTDSGQLEMLVRPQ